VVSKHYKRFMSHSTNVFMLYVGLSCICFVLSVGLFCNLFSVSEVGCLLLSCSRNAVALFLLFNESVIVYVLNFYASFVFMQKLFSSSLHSF